jgi:HSP90 family molecular chaperone
MSTAAKEARLQAEVNNCSSVIPPCTGTGDLLRELISNASDGDKLRFDSIADPSLLEMIPT